MQTFPLAKAVPCLGRWCSRSSFRRRPLALASASSMSDAPPDIRRRYWRALAPRWLPSKKTVVWPLAAGWRAGAPYDGILLNGAAEVIPEVFGDQLKPDGWLIGVGGRPPACKGMVYRVSEGCLVGRPIFDAAATLLPGFRAPPSFVF